MDLGIPSDITFYKLLTDWGGLIGAVAALIAAIIAYIAICAQIKEAREENREHRHSRTCTGIASPTNPGASR